MLIDDFGLKCAPKSQLGTKRGGARMDEMAEMEEEGFSRIRMQGQNGLHNTKLRVFLSVLQNLEVPQELLGGVGRSTIWAE